MGRPYVTAYAYASRSAPAFVAAYGLRGLSGCSSSMGACSAVPYTSLDEMRTKRSTGVSRTASRRICVPSTFVVTNSEAPSRIDFSTCDSAAAFTITSTPGHDLAHELGVADVALHEGEPLVRHHVREVLDVAGVRERVERHDLVRGRREQVPDDVRRDEPGAARHENALAHSSFSIV